MFASEDDFLPLSAINDLLFCERRCALHRIEGVWTENVHTTEGTLSHRRVHDERDGEASRGGVRAARGLRLRSERLGLVGVADLVEFRPIPFPVEYKRGKRRRWDNDDVQLCAQAICLEEMLGVSVPAGAIFHVKTARRREVAFDEPLRAATVRAAERLHELVRSGTVPRPVVHPKCKQCSLYQSCMPELLVRTDAVAAAARTLFQPQN